MKPIGVIDWAGMYGECPAFVVSYYGGASLWYCENQQWLRIKFNSKREVYDEFGSSNRLPDKLSQRDF